MFICFRASVKAKLAKRPTARFTPVGGVMLWCLYASGRPAKPKLLNVRVLGLLL